jgi:hypothetical protein
MAYVERFDSERAGDAPIDDAGNTHLHLVAENGAGYDVRGVPGRARFCDSHCRGFCT